MFALALSVGHAGNQAGGEIRQMTQTFARGQKVTIPQTRGMLANKPAWWPTGDLSGTVCKHFKNGMVSVKVDQMPRQKTIHFCAPQLKGCG